MKTPIEIANHIPTLERVPIACRSTWCRINGRVLVQYARASRDNDQEGKLRSIVEWMSLPGEVLGTSTRVGRVGRGLAVWLTEYYGGRREVDEKAQNQDIFQNFDQNPDLHINNTINNRGTYVLNHSPPNRLTHIIDRVIVRNVSSEPLEPPRDSEKLEEKAVRRANKLVRGSYMTRAARALLNSSPIAMIEEEGTRSKLRELHPAPVIRPVPLLNASMVANKKHIYSGDDKKFKDIIKEMNDGKAAGPSGWTGALLKDLVRDQECLRGLACLATDIHNAEIPKEAVEYLTHCNLTPLSKNDKGDNMSDQLLWGKCFSDSFQSWQFV